ncbi:uncharacterized protein LOC110693208 isoform X2 [Chenopodium quinoa]|uniref:uncharacterized protein LOC110693208 isoform X2 n=1 Tax=Chenopodium quinoa TaxID=63459 RepID=UPI000B78F990|nr:uncharacterized protein LOC110693208 isoform X2 [Chenopodium quinoa]
MLCHLFYLSFLHVKEATKMTAWFGATRQAAQLTRLSSSKLAGAPPFIQRRGFSSGGDHHGPPKVNFWQDPLSPSRWKEEQFVIVSLAGWGTLFYGSYKFFVRDKKEKKDEVNKLEKIAGET